MAITLKPEVERWAEEQAHKQGLSSASAYVEQTLEAIRKQGQPLTRGQRAVERLRGTAAGGLTTDEIMEMTRSEV